MLIPELIVIMSQAMEGIKALVNVITHLKKLIRMKKNTNTMEPKKKRKIILLSAQFVLEVAGLGMTFRKGELSTFGLLVPSHQKILKSK